MLQERQEQKSITADGGIIKIPIKNGTTEIDWKRGCNARFYYKAFAYIPPSQETESHTENCSSNCKHSHEEKQESLKQKADLLKTLLEGKKPKQKPVDPSQKPVRTLISDSKTNDKNPFDLRIGYSFSVKAMELCIKSMKMGEISRFLCMPEYCEGFIQLETVMRQEKINTERKSKGLAPLSVGGCCAHASPEVMEISRGLESALGVPLEFEFELVQVQQPNSFTKEIWELEPIQKYNEIPIRKQEGGECYKKGDYQGALMKYERCLTLLESLSNTGIVLDLKKEQMDLKRGIVTESIIPSDNKIELSVLDELFQVCRLNYAACQLKLKDYKMVITMCSKVLETDDKCIKALFRRAQAYIETGMHLDLAKKDIERLELLEMEKTELQRLKKQLDVKFKIYNQKEKIMYGNLFA